MAPPERVIRSYMWSESEAFAHSDSLTFAMYSNLSMQRALRLLARGKAASPVESATRATHDEARRPYKSSGPIYVAVLARRIGAWTLVMQPYGSTVIGAPNTRYDEPACEAVLPGLLLRRSGRTRRWCTVGARWWRGRDRRLPMSPRKDSMSTRLASNRCSPCRVHQAVYWRRSRV